MLDKIPKSENQIMMKSFDKNEKTGYKYCYGFHFLNINPSDSMKNNNMLS